MRRGLAAASAVAVLAASAGVDATQQEARISAPLPATAGITNVPGIKVGQVTRTERLTGCTVILVEAGAVAGVDVRGSAPGTIETDLLDPVNLVQQVHAVFLAGGSAFGLDVAAGVRQLLYERKIGFETKVAKVPIVPGAILFDLGVGNRPDIWPTAECGYRAAAAAASGPVAEGNVGAGAGATIGKTGGGGAMKGGLGTASISVSAGADTLIVGAIVAVNAVGDVIDPSNGTVVAGVRTPDGKGLADARKLLRASAAPIRPGQNTTIGVVATNARLTKVQATKVAQMAQDGLARAIYPAHTMGDGDAIFALATGAIESVDVSRIGALAADAMAEAIIRAVRQAKGIPGYPAVQDMAGQ
jgi:L-aminopeptidase/D-esterase-like protein